MRYDTRKGYEALVARILEGEGDAPQYLRRAAFDGSGLQEPLASLVEKVANQPTRVSDGDFSAVKTSGLAEEQIFELVICAAVGASSRQYEAATKALDEAAKGNGGFHAS